MKPRFLLSTSLGLIALSLLLTGCSSIHGDAESPRQEVSRSDTSAGKGSSETGKAAAAAEPQETTPAVTTDEGGQPQPTPVPPANEGTLTVDAMIGQVNGRPIYASQVLEPLKSQLNTMGQQMSRGEFRSTVARILSERLYQIVFDALFLAEAERQMTEQERFQLKVMMHLNRQELIRKYGAGSEPAADVEMKKTTGRSLDETLEGIRQTILVRRYQEQVIYPKIAVSKRDIERFYNRPEIYERYNPKPGRKIRLIMVSDATNAAKVDKQLAEGVPFIEIASGPLNKSNPSSGGKYTLVDKNNKETDVLVGDKLFGPDVLNEALSKLKAGEHSPRVEVALQSGKRYYWILLEEVIQGESKSLPQVQLEIEQQIRGLQYTMIEQRYRKKLFEDAGYLIDGSTANPLEEMAKALVNIAVGLYTKE